MNKPLLNPIKIIAISILCAILTVSYVSAENNGPMAISMKDKCGNCNMMPAKFPQWQAQIIYADKSMTSYDGCKCMFKHTFSPEQKGKEISTVWVKDFNNGKWLNAKDAYFVCGSEIMGPMGKELIPFSDHMAAMTFQKSNGGDIAKYSDISMATLKPLMGGKMMHNKSSDSAMHGSSHKM